LTAKVHLCYNGEAILETVSIGGVNLGGRHPLRLNVGFFLHESVGFSRTFDYDLGPVFFSEDLQVNTLRGSMRFTRTAQGIYATGRLIAELPQTCVRCLSPFDLAVMIEFSDLFVFPPERAEEAILAIPETGILDLAPLAREYILLEIPIQPMCKPDCLGLCPICGGDRNETPCEHQKQEFDPRFAALKTLLDTS
jgi:uncharacterized protein